VPLIGALIFLNLVGELRNVTQSNGDCCANSPPRAGKVVKVLSFQYENDLACGLQITNAENAEGLRLETRDLSDVTEGKVGSMIEAASINPDEKTDLTTWLKMVGQLRHWLRLLTSETISASKIGGGER
jgi:hypothetical protein